METEHVELIVGDFSEDSFNEGPMTILFQSLGFTQIVSEPTHIIGAWLDQTYFRYNQNSFLNLDVRVTSNSV